MISQDQIISLTSILVVFISLLFAAYLFSAKSNNAVGNRLFAGFLLISAIDLSGLFLYPFTPDYPGLAMLRIHSSLLGMPLLYLYVRSLCFADFRLKPVQLLHALPFVLVMLLFLPDFFLAEKEAKMAFFGSYMDQPEVIIRQTTGHLQVLAYLLAIVFLLKRYRRLYRENYGNTSNQTYPWLMQLTALLLFAHSLVIVKTVLKHTPYAAAFVWLQLAVSLFALFILCWFVLKALHQPELFRGIDSSLVPAKQLVRKEQPAAETNNPVQQEQPTQAERLLQYMQEKEPFLDASLSLQQLARQLKMPARDLSVLINHQMGQHFFDFVNAYRIDKARELLTDPEESDKTVLEILYAVGFNSKSSFNTAFKKHSGLTPTQYRKTHSKQAA